MSLAPHGVHLTLLVRGQANVLQGVRQLLRHQLNNEEETVRINCIG